MTIKYFALIQISPLILKKRSLINCKHEHDNPYQRIDSNVISKFTKEEIKIYSLPTQESTVSSEMINACQS